MNFEVHVTQMRKVLLLFYRKQGSGAPCLKCTPKNHQGTPGTRPPNLGPTDRDREVPRLVKSDRVSTQRESRPADRSTILCVTPRHCTLDQPWQHLSISWRAFFKNVQFLGLHPRLITLQFLGIEPGRMFGRPPGGSDTQPELKAAVLDHSLGFQGSLGVILSSPPASMPKDVQ